MTTNEFLTAFETMVGLPTLKYLEALMLRDVGTTMYFNCMVVIVSIV